MQQGGRSRRGPSAQSRAIEDVLEAERAAEAAVEDARAQAQKILSAARDQAGRIGARADALVTRAHRRFDASVERSVADLWRDHERRQRERAAAATDQDRIRRALDHTIAWLLGDASNAPGTGS